MIGVGSFLGLGNTLKSFGVAVNAVFASVVSAFNADGDADDELAYANGTLTNGATATGTAKVGTYSFSFDGVNDYITFPNNSWNLLGDYSFSCWFLTTDNAQRQTIIGNFTGFSGNYKGWYLELSGGNLVLHVTNNATLSYAWNPSNNTWYHVAFTRVDAGTIIFYINGSQVATSSIAIQDTYAATQYCRIGVLEYDVASFQGYMKGRLDAIQIFSSALTAGDITTLYNSGNGLQYPN